jgi:UDP-N-acetylglucosamine 4-epimerase
MKTMELQIAAGSRFLVTGGAGFIGSNLCEAITKMGFSVTCLDNLSAGKLENIVDLLGQANFTFKRGDIRDLNTCLDACEGVDYVLHQAAYGSVPRSIEFPLEYEENNIRGTLNMLEASRRHSVKKFVYASSSSVYGDDANLPKKEGIEGELLSPYAITKRVNEEYGRIYWNIYRVPTVGLRYFNVYGPKQNPQGHYAAVIPRWVQLLLNNEHPTIYGDGEQSRDFTYIEDVIQANLLSVTASGEAFGEIFNIAHGSRITLKELYSTLCHILDVSINPIFKPARTGDILHSNANNAKAKENLNISPSWDFQKGIRKAVAWYRQNLSDPKTSC